jgi:hypothetical protein
MTLSYSEAQLTMKIIRGALASFIVLAAAANIAYAKDPPLISLSMDHFRDTATVKNDAVADKITISTENGFIEHTGPLRMVWTDEFLRGVIDTKTGQKSFEINAWVTYSGKWRGYESANYQGQNGPRSAATTQIRKEMANCPVGECTYTEHVAFPVDEELLRQIAAGYVQGKPIIWEFKLIAKSGPAHGGGLSNAEIAGFLSKVDEYTGPHAVAKPQATSAPRKLDLGVGGIPIAASAKQPNRAGILIVDVNGDSVAERSDIIVGDILHEFNGRPIRNLADLQTAVAACPAGSAVVIKLYRGINEILVTAQF